MHADKILTAAAKIAPAPLFEPQTAKKNARHPTSVLLKRTPRFSCRGHQTREHRSKKFLTFAARIIMPRAKPRFCAAGPNLCPQGIHTRRAYIPAGHTYPQGIHTRRAYTYTRASGGKSEFARAGLPCGAHSTGRRSLKLLCKQNHAFAQQDPICAYLRLWGKGECGRSK